MIARIPVIVMAIWRVTMKSEARKRAAKNYYAKHRLVLIMANTIRNRGVKPPSLKELRQRYVQPETASSERC